MGLSSVEFVWCWHCCCHVESFGIIMFLTEETFIFFSLLWEKIIQMYPVMWKNFILILDFFLQIFSLCQTVNQRHIWVLTLVECIDTYITMYLNVPVMLKKLDGQQNTHQIFLKFLYIICLVIVYQLISNREKKKTIIF